MVKKLNLKYPEKFGNIVSEVIQCCQVAKFIRVFKKMLIFYINREHVLMIIQNSVYFRTFLYIWCYKTKIL